MKKILCFLGTSGSGKTTLVNYLKRYNIPELISCTTRNSRKGEKNGITYWFVDENEFKNLNKVEETEYSGNKYCLDVSEIERKLKNNDFVCVILDINGVKQLKQKYGGIVKVIYLDCTPLEIINRMFKRGDTKKDIKKRIEYAFESGEFLNVYASDYIIRNIDLKITIKQLKLILKHEGYSCWEILWGDIKYYFKRWFK